MPQLAQWKKRFRLKPTLRLSSIKGIIPMKLLSIKLGAICLFFLGSIAVTGPDLVSTAEASTVSAQRSRQCSAEARRWADRHTRRNTAAGAAGGAAIGAIASGSRRNTGRNAGRGALIGGGAGLIGSSGRWQTYYNYAYRNCVRR